MSISLYSAPPTYTAAGVYPILGMGNYALTDIQISMYGMVAVTSGGVNFLGQLLSSIGNEVQATFGYLNGAATAGTYTSSQFLFQRSFPDGLILPRGNGLNMFIQSFSGISSVILLINISGTVLP